MNRITEYQACFEAMRPRAAGRALALASVLLLTLASTPPARAQTYTLLYSFQCQPDGSNPQSTLLVDPSGNLYGTTSSGGTYVSGTLFELSPEWVETILHSFAGGAEDGAQPEHTALLRDGAGNIYGVTPFGGNHDSGVVYKLSPTAAETILHQFAPGSSGTEPFGGLLRDQTGNLYGTTYGGGDLSCGGGGGCGTVFELTSPSGQEKVLFSFPPGPNGPGLYGQLPEAGLVRDSAGNLYGTTTTGGNPQSRGTVFELSASGQETVLHEFTGGPDGSFPNAPLVRDSAGNMYGATPFGGGRNYGTVFKIASGGQYSVLHNFTTRQGGVYPAGPVAEDAAGDIFGVTENGGTGLCQGGFANGCGAIFKLSPSGSEQVLYNFLGEPDGQYPLAGVTRDSHGNLYGTTSEGGAYGCGTVWKFTP